VGKKLYCNYCGYEIVKDYLDKIKGTYVKIRGGLYYIICDRCQSLLWKRGITSRSALVDAIRREGKIKDPYDLRK
jgi:hypothetical protein